MKILITTDSYTYQVNGVTTSIITLRDELKALGHDVRVLALSPKHKSFKDECDYYIGSFPVFLYPQARVSFRTHSHLIKEIVDWNPDIIHIQTEFTTRTMATKIAKKLKKPTVSTCHTKYEDYIAYFCPSKKLGKIIVKRLSNQFYNKSKALVVPSDKIQELETQYGLNCPIVVIPTGIDLTKFQKELTADERVCLKKEYNIPEGITLLVSVSRLGTEKNIQELVSYMPALLKENPDIRYMIVGDGPYRKKLEKQVKGLNLTNKVFFTGMIDNSEIYKYYQLGDIFISASTSETQGLTYVEAMANGKPLVCKNDKCLKNVVYEGINGYVFNNEREFVESINKLIRENKIEQFGKESKDRAAIYSKEIFGKHIESLYKDIIAQSI